jgi:dihydrofolate reductase
VNWAVWERPVGRCRRVYPIDGAGTGDVDFGTGGADRGKENEMGRIVVSDNITLDGVVQDPAGDEGFPRGGWVGLIQDRPELARLTLSEATGTGALLMGRRTYEWFAARWPTRSGELADRLNAMPKYVVSSTLDHPDWNNTTVIKGDVLAAVSRLKDTIDGDIVVSASLRIARLLLEHDLADEVRLKVFPVVLGAGERLFGETAGTKAMRLVDVRVIDGETVLLTYVPDASERAGGNRDRVEAAAVGAATDRDQSPPPHEPTT